MRPTPVSLFALPGIPFVEPGDDLAAILARALTESEVGLRDGDVLVVAQKIVSKAEGRFVDLAAVKPSVRGAGSRDACGKDPRLVEVILPSRAEVVRCAPQVLIVRAPAGLS